MKRIFILVLAVVGLSLVACKNETKDQEATDQPALLDNEFAIYSGEYFYSDDGAVLKGNNFIYAVTLDEMAKELADKIAPVKKEEYDMVPVVVRGVVGKNPALNEGKEVWEEIITIKEIVSVGNTPAGADIKIEESKS